jgi:hypothetical protein
MRMLTSHSGKGFNTNMFFKKIKLEFQTRLDKWS